MAYTFEDFKREWTREKLAEMTPEERLRGLSPEDLVRSLRPEDRLLGLRGYPVQYLRVEGKSLTFLNMSSDSIIWLVFLMLCKS
jgi:hypothetical protein